MLCSEWSMAEAFPKVAFMALCGCDTLSSLALLSWFAFLALRLHSYQQRPLDSERICSWRQFCFSSAPCSCLQSFVNVCPSILSLMYPYRLPLRSRA